MQEYNMNKASQYIADFLDNLTNRYIRRSRRRFRKSENDGDKIEAYNTLYFVLVEFSKILAPFCPFISEHIFKALTGRVSVHLEDFPVANQELINEKLSDQMQKAKKIIST